MSKIDDTIKDNEEFLENWFKHNPHFVFNQTVKYNILKNIIDDDLDDVDLNQLMEKVEQKFEQMQKDKK